jgi:death-on-curing protein
VSRDYLSVDDVLAIHAEQVERYGGTEGLRNPSGLESAVARPQSGYYSDVIAEAAALWESLSQNHPFVDGNKRTAFSATFRFLALNDVAITADANEVWRFLSRPMRRGTLIFRAWKRGYARIRKRSIADRSIAADEKMSGALGMNGAVSVCTAPRLTHPMSVPMLRAISVRASTRRGPWEGPR